MACTPASVRPAPSTTTRSPPERRASAVSSSPWTVRPPGWIWKPAKSVPSYSTVARYRRGRPSRDPVIGLDEFELHDLRGITLPLADVHDPGVAGLAVGVLRGDLVEQLVHDERLVRQGRHHRASRCQIALLGEGDHPLDVAADLLGLGLGGLDALIAQHGDGQVLVQGEPRPHLPAELPAIDAMRHGSGLLAFVERGVALVLVVVTLAQVVALGLRDDEPAHAEALLHLVERLLAEVAHAEQVLVLELEELPDLDDVVALQR